MHAVAQIACGHRGGLPSFLLLVSPVIENPSSFLGCGQPKHGTVLQGLVLRRRGSNYRNGGPDRGRKARWAVRQARVESTS